MPRRHRAAQHLPWYIGAELWVTRPGPGLTNLEVAPDLFVAEGDGTSRTSWNVAVEGQPPRFVLEIVTGASWLRDTTEKPVLYERLKPTTRPRPQTRGTPSVRSRVAALTGCAYTGTRNK